MKQFPKVSSTEVAKLATSPYFTDRIAAAKAQGIGEDMLSILVNDDCWKVRLAVAKSGYGLNTLMRDSEWRVREAVAQQGHGLASLRKDKHYAVRQAVARQGYGLDMLVHDEEPMVRATVADMGFGLDTLINDPVPKVREVVASKGYGLDILIDDSDEYIRAVAKAYKDDPSLLGYVGVVDTKDCFTPEENNPYICVGQRKEECNYCQLSVDWTPDDEEAETCLFG